MSKHTPGPWHVVTNTDGGTDVVHTFGRAPGESYNEVALDIDTEPNARLIAAAPDLLEASKDALQGLKEALRPGTSTNTREILLQAVQNDLAAAIAKATGEA